MDTRRTYSTVPNQLVVKILPYEKEPSEFEPYGIISRRAEEVAARLLNDRTASHILYYYFALNQSGYEFALSPKAIYNSLGVTAKQYGTAKKRLIKAGFLVQSKSGSNLWYFVRIPREYETINEVPAASGEVSCLDCTGNPSLEGQTIPTQRDRPSPPNGIECMPSERGRNNTNNTLYNKRILLDSSSTEDKANSFPTEKQSDNLPTDEETVSSLLERGYQEFGYLDAWEQEVSSLDQYMQRYCKRHTLNEAEYTKMYICHLERLIKKYREERTARRNISNNEYRRWLESADGGMLSSQRTVFNLIKGAIKKEQPLFPTGKGLWIEGWNEKEKKPNILRALYWVPKKLLEKRHNDIEDVPEEYYSETEEHDDK